MTTQTPAGRGPGQADMRWRWGPLDIVGVMMILPAALGVLCVISRAWLSSLSQAAVPLVFLICLVSALAGLLAGFWIRPRALARSVQIVGIAWVAICAWRGGSFVLGLVQVVLSGAP